LGDQGNRSTETGFPRLPRSGQAEGHNGQYPLRNPHNCHLSSRCLYSTGSPLVEELVAEIKKITSKQHHSFAAKYPHFFINPDLPILDWYAEAMLSQHLGSMASKNPKRYLKFVEDTGTLKEVAGLTCNCADLDAYLWVVGEYWYWKEHQTAEINGDLRLHFERLARDHEK
jgi:hypothetical protein